MILFSALARVIENVPAVASKLFDEQKTAERYVRDAVIKSNPEEKGAAGFGTIQVFLGEIHLGEDFRLTYNKDGDLIQIARGHYHMDNVVYNELPSILALFIS